MKGEVIIGYHKTSLTQCGVCGGVYIAFIKLDDTTVRAECWCGARSTMMNVTAEEMEQFYAETHA